MEKVDCGRAGVGREEGEAEGEACGVGSREGRAERSEEAGRGTESGEGEGDLLAFAAAFRLGGIVDAGRGRRRSAGAAKLVSRSRWPLAAPFLLWLLWLLRRFAKHIKG